MKHPMTPFPTSGYFGPEYFCDRVLESRTLLENIKSGQSTTLISLRRLGKTALIHHVHYQLKEEFICIYTDLLSTENMQDMRDNLTSAIIRAVPEESTFGQRLWTFVKSLRPVISYDSLSGEPSVSFNTTVQESRKQIESLFDFLETLEKPVLISIDEFQQIVSYPEEQTDAWLRTKIQQLKNVVFIFSGSHQHLMNELFTKTGRPFFRSTLLLNLGDIDREVYKTFIIAKFNSFKIEISDEVAIKILEWTKGYTYYVQLLCNRIFICAQTEVTEELWKTEASKLLQEQQYVFYSYRDMLTKQQWRLIKALASEGKTYNPTSKDFVSKYQLGSPSTVLRSLESLKGMELIFHQYDDMGKSFYSVYDLLFQRWMELR